MHLMMLLSIVGLAWGLRYAWSTTAIDLWIDRWQQTLALFVLPPLLLFTSAIAIIWMGPFGQMVWMREGWLTYCAAVIFLLFAAICLVKLAKDSQQILQQIRHYPIDRLQDCNVRVLDSIALYSAQIGFWQPELVVTRGLLDTLDSEHLAAVLAHERAHHNYRDTFWFFWLGWLRRVTTWLPQTEAMWQELLVLRELRADRWASRQTDPLLVAEALLSVVQNLPICSEPFCAAFSEIAPVDRLNQRIDALFTTADLADLDRSINWQFWAYLPIALLPLIIVPFHR